MPVEEDAPASVSDPLIGSLLAGKYKVLARVAQGGMARIYKAEQLPLGRIVALKLLLPPRDPFEDDPMFQKRFFLEASTCAKFTHPNTVTIFDYGYNEDDKTFYMVMEFVEGRTLADALRDDGPFPPVRALTIAIEIVRSLEEAHQHKVVHRDLKPANIMLVDTVEGERVKVLDFGIAKVLQHETLNMTMEDSILGTPRYMSPEQVRSEQVDERTDLYAMGIILFEMICGHPPYRGKQTMGTLLMHINSKIPSVRQHSPWPNLPDPLVEIIESCLAKSADERPRSSSELKQLLRAALLDAMDTTTGSDQLSTQSIVRRARDLSDELGDANESVPTLDQTGERRRTRAMLPIFMILAVFGAMVAVSLLAVLVFTLGATFATSGSPVPAPVEVTESVELVEPLPAPAPVAAPLLRLSSMPIGAIVWEGEVALGPTPIALPLGSPEQPERSFELRLEGYEPFAVSQGPSDIDVDVLAELVPLAPTPAPAPRKNLDIINER